MPSAIDVEGRSDAELVRAAAGSDAGAFEELYRRHSVAAWRTAQAVTADPEDARDAVGEAFARVLKRLRSRGDDLLAFRPYLLAVARNVAIDITRSRCRVDVTEHLEDLDGATTAAGPPDQVEADEDVALAARAFQHLPPRLRSVLWSVDVEGRPPRQVATAMGLSPNHVAQLAVRARARLRRHYLQAHVPNHADERCAFAVERLGSYLDGSLPAKSRARVDAHLSGCDPCRRRVDTLNDLGIALRALPPGLFTYFAGTEAGPGLRFRNTLRLAWHWASTPRALPSWSGDLQGLLPKVAGSVAVLTLSVQVPVVPGALRPEAAAEAVAGAAVSLDAGDPDEAAGQELAGHEAASVAAGPAGAHAGPQGTEPVREPERRAGDQAGTGHGGEPGGHESATIRPVVPVHNSASAGPHEAALRPPAAPAASVGDHPVPATISAGAVAPSPAAVPRDVDAVDAAPDEASAPMPAPAAAPTPSAPGGPAVPWPEGPPPPPRGATTRTAVTPVVPAPSQPEVPATTTPPVEGDRVDVALPPAPAPDPHPVPPALAGDPSSGGVIGDPPKDPPPTPPAAPPAGGEVAPAGGDVAAPAEPVPPPAVGAPSVETSSPAPGNPADPVPVSPVAAPAL